jgi:hypothetical protein
MCKRFPLRLALLILIVAAFSPLIGGAQSQDSSTPSVAEAARRARQLKKKSDKPVVVVVDDDTLKHAPPAATNTSAAPGGSPAGTPGTAPSPDSSTPAEQAPAPTPAGKSADKLKALKQQLVEAQKNVELAQIDLSLQQDTYFSNPDYIHDKDGKAKIDAMQLDVKQKEQIVDELKVKIAALEAQNPSTTPAPTQP